jgi:sulfonate transport system substrate-binding protein
MSTLNRRSALGSILSVTAASWWPQARANNAPLRIGFQKGSINLTITRSLKLVEQRLPGTPVQWVEFPAGPQLLEALAVGSIEFGAVGDSPPVFAQAAGKDIVYVGAEPNKPDTSALLVRQDSPLKSIADLKAKRIALQKGSSAHYLLVQIVRKAGLQWSDIQPIYLAPADARAAFERGSVDAWSIWDPYYAAAELDGRARPLVTSRGLTSNNSFYLASRGLVQQEAVLRHLFAALTEADAYVYKNRADTAKQYAEFSGLGLATVLRFLDRRPRSPVGPLTPALVAEQQKVADAFHELGLIPKAIRVADIVWQPA